MITLLPTAPSRSMASDVYVSTFNIWIAALAQFVTETNALAANLNTVAGGTAYAIPFVFDSSTVDADPVNGRLRFNSTTQNTATTLYTDLLGSDTIDYTSILDTLDASTSGVKGQIRLMKQGDATKFLTFNLMLRTTATGYRKFTVINTGGSSANPFTAGDGVVMVFTRTGDVGSAGTLVRRVAPDQVNPSSITPNVTAYDMLTVSGLAQSLSINAPTGTPTDGQTLVIRIKDNGTSRAISTATIYRASNELPFPSATNAGKVMYMGFTYDAADAKWHLLALIQNM